MEEIDEKKVKSIMRKVKALDKAIQEAGLQVYLGAGCFHLMKGGSHTDKHKATPENIVASYTPFAWDGGDW